MVSRSPFLSLAVVPRMLDPTPHTVIFVSSIFILYYLARSSTVYAVIIFVNDAHSLFMYSLFPWINYYLVPSKMAQ